MNTNKYIMYALVDISNTPKIVSTHQSLAEAIEERENNYKYRYLYTFKLVTDNGIQELSGVESIAERKARKKILDKDAEIRRQEKNKENI